MSVYHYYREITITELISMLDEWNSASLKLDVILIW